MAVHFGIFSSPATEPFALKMPAVWGLVNVFVPEPTGCIFKQSLWTGETENSR
jgi:hypothetical protein